MFQCSIQTDISIPYLLFTAGLHLRRFHLSPGTFHGRELTGDPPEPQIMQECIDNLFSCIEDRFTPEKSCEFDLTAATTTLDFNSWPLDIDEG
jgi:hypothetical protein